MKKYKILFIGNSYTYYNDMPDILSGIAASVGYEAEVCAITKGGEKLLGHVCMDGETYPRIKETLEQSRFDFAVLQEQSLRPMLDPELFFEGGMKLSALISGRVDNIVLYATWARRWDSEFFGDHPMKTSEMTERLDSAYSHLGELIGARVAHVGCAFERVGSDRLYADDASHPSYSGSCLAALILFRAIFDVSDDVIMTLPRIGELSAAESEIIKKAALS